MADLIYDVGAHTGEDSAFYLEKGFHVVAVEAMPQHAEWLRMRFARAIREGRLLVEEAAVGDSAGPGEFYIHPDKTDWHRATPDDARGEFDIIKVQFETFDNILARHPR